MKFWHLLPSKKDQEEGKRYVVGNSFDPVMQKKLGDERVAPFVFMDYVTTFAEKSEKVQDGYKVIKALEEVLFPMNMVFVLESGDIGFGSGGLFPKRKHGVV